MCDLLQSYFNSLLWPVFHVLVLNQVNIGFILLLQWISCLHGKLRRHAWTGSFTLLFIDEHRHHKSKYPNRCQDSIYILQSALEYLDCLFASKCGEMKAVVWLETLPNNMFYYHVVRLHITEWWIFNNQTVSQELPVSFLLLQTTG